MATPAEVAQYRDTITALSTAAIADGKALLDEVADSDPIRVRNQLLGTVPELVAPYEMAAAEFTATWYEELRRQANARGTMYAVAAPQASVEQKRALVRYAVSPLFDQSAATVLSLLGGGLQKLIAGAGRNTVDLNVRRDRTRVRYARTPQAGCCAFCAMLASRGAVYGSEGAATGVVGRGVEAHRAYSSSGRYLGMRGGGVKTGAQGLGDRYHNHCRCVATPVWEGQDVPYDIDHYQAMYDAVPYGSLDGILSAMRQQFGLK